MMYGAFPEETECPYFFMENTRKTQELHRIFGVKTGKKCMDSEIMCTFAAHLVLVLFT